MFLTKHKFVVNPIRYSQYLDVAISELNDLWQLIKTMVNRRDALGEIVGSKEYSGCIHNLIWDEKCLSVTETTEMYLECAAWRRLASKFPHVKYYWHSEELEYNICATNDRDGRFFVLGESWMGHIHW